jgi:hypothetical protein
MAFGDSFEILVLNEFKSKLNFETKDIFKLESNNFQKASTKFWVLNLNLIRTRTKADTFFSHYKSNAIHQYKNKCMTT